MPVNANQLAAPVTKSSCCNLNQRAHFYLSWNRKVKKFIENIDNLLKKMAPAEKYEIVISHKTYCTFFVTFRGNEARQYTEMIDYLRNEYQKMGWKDFNVCGSPYPYCLVFERQPILSCQNTRLDLLSF